MKNVFVMRDFLDTDMNNYLEAIRIATENCDEKYGKDNYRFIQEEIYAETVADIFNGRYKNSDPNILLVSNIINKILIEKVKDRDSEFLFLFVNNNGKLDSYKWCNIISYIGEMIEDFEVAHLYQNRD